MANAFERFAVQRIIDQATAAGVHVPAGLGGITCGGSLWAARVWAEANPDAEVTGCCYGEALDGPQGCTCWRPVFEQEQQSPRPLEGPQDVPVAGRMCGDCAFRKGSPERADAWSEEALFALAETGRPFWCHDGMRRPVRWEHPDGRAVAGDPDDWQPPIVAGIPYRVDGSPGLLCAGWAARARYAADGGGQ